ncbi:MAG: TolC family protein [Ottowia sp.]
MRFSHLPAALALAALAAAPAAAQNLATLHQAARQHDSALQAARAAVDAAHGRAGQARAALLPQLALTGDAFRHHADVTLDHHGSRRAYNQQSAALSASQSLYRPANGLTARQGQRQIPLAQARLQAAEQALIARVAQAYFDVLAAHDSLELARAFKAAVGQQLEAARQSFDAGAATIVDSREAQARHDLARAQEIAAENEWRIAQLALSQITGQPAPDPRPLAQPAPAPEALARLLLTPEAAEAPAATAEQNGQQTEQQAEQQAARQADAWAHLAEQHHPAVAQARLALEVAELEIEKAKAGHLPSVDLQARYGWQRNPDGNPSIHARPFASYRHGIASAGVAVTIPLFTGFAVQERVRETLALQEQARAELQGAQEAAAQAARSASYQLQSALARLQALLAAEQSSLTALQASQTGYEVGVRINIDVLNAQTQLYQTRRDLAHARYAVLTGALKLRQASGTLTEADLNPINAWLAP